MAATNLPSIDDRVDGQSMGAAGDPLKLKGSPYETLPRENKKRLREPHPVDGPGYPVGRDPRKPIDAADYAACGHGGRSVLQAIRAKCLDCCCQQESEVRYCVATFCPLWPFSDGHEPVPSAAK